MTWSNNIYIYTTKVYIQAFYNLLKKHQWAKYPYIGVDRKQTYVRKKTELFHNHIKQRLAECTFIIYIHYSVFRQIWLECFKYVEAYIRNNISLKNLLQNFKRIREIRYYIFTSLKNLFSSLESNLYANDEKKVSIPTFSI